MEIAEINKRYTDLSDSECCLSCGSAIDYSGAKTGDVCVDLGSGRGTDAIRLAEIVGENGFVYGIDISEGMLKAAQHNAEKFAAKNVKFIQSDLEKIDLPSKTANIIISNCTINHASDKQSVWNEIYRILKGKGKFIVSDIFSKEEVPDKYKNDPIAVSECWAGSVTKKVYLRQLADAGFENVTILEESKPYIKGKIEVSSFTIAGTKPACNCGR